MIPSFATLNNLNSISMEDVKRYTTLALETSPSASTFDYLGPGDLSNAHLWNGDHFNYTINEYGFREEHTPEQVDIGAFGCSFTFGTGLPDHMLWHKLLASKLGLSAYNFGSPAKSIESIVDIFLIASKHISMKHAIFLLPSFTRKQIAKTHPYDNDVVNYITTDLSFQFNSLREYGIDCDLVYRALPDEELLKACRDKIYLLDYVAKERGIKVYVSSWEKQTYELLQMMNFTNIVLLPRWESMSMELSDNDLARDHLHPGPQHHILWHDLIKDYII